MVLCDNVARETAQKRLAAKVITVDYHCDVTVFLCFMEDLCLNIC